MSRRLGNVYKKQFQALSCKYFQVLREHAKKPAKDVFIMYFQIFEPAKKPAKDVFVMYFQIFEPAKKLAKDVFSCMFSCVLSVIQI